MDNSNSITSMRRILTHYSRLRSSTLLQAFNSGLHPATPWRSRSHQTLCKSSCTLFRTTSIGTSFTQSRTQYRHISSRTPQRANRINTASLESPPAKEAKQPQTTQSLFAYVKKAATNGAFRKLYNAVTEAEEGTGPWGETSTKPDANIYRTAIRGLLKAERPDLAVELYRMRMKARENRPGEIGADGPLAASVVRAVLRECKKRKQKAVDSDDIFREMLKDSREDDNMDKTAVAKMVSALLSVMSAFLAEDDLGRAMEALDGVHNMSLDGVDVNVSVGDYNNAIRHLGKKKSMNGVFKVLDIMRASRVEPDNETFEFLANAAVRQVEFVTGAVSMDTLPEPLGSEVAFVGRSNVGKSSLVNMICNRKALAYVSGTPGKTQQFNYFLVNGKDKASQFHMVDLPGVGYAKVPKPVKEAWMNFMRQYFSYRTSLRVVFHLVDGRHGALADDEELMREISGCGRTNEYVVVLTKMDKNDKQKAKRSILDKTRAALVRNGCRSDTPIVLTSSTTKLGREEMWRHLQAALTTFSSVNRFEATPGV